MNREGKREELRWGIGSPSVDSWGVDGSRVETIDSGDREAHNERRRVHEHPEEAFSIATRAESESCRRCI